MGRGFEERAKSREEETRALDMLLSLFGFRAG
jgi:hypothetical protein